MADEEKKWNEFEIRSMPSEGSSAEKDAGKCCGFCCRMPITSLAIFGGAIFALSYFPNHPDPIMRIGGTGLTILVLALIVGGLYNRYTRR